MTASNACRRGRPTARTASPSVNHGGSSAGCTRASQIEWRHERQPVAAAALAHLFGRRAELLAKRAGERFVRAVAGIQRHRQDVRVRLNASASAARLNRRARRYFTTDQPVVAPNALARCERDTPHASAIAGRLSSPAGVALDDPHRLVHDGHAWSRTCHAGTAT